MLDREIDLREWLEWFRHSVDWLFFGMVGLAVLNVLFGVYLAWTILMTPAFFDRYELARSSTIVEQASGLEEVPPLEELEADTPSSGGSLPTRYVELGKGTLFVPLEARLKGVPEGTSDDTAPEKTLPRIEGYEVVGRITGQAGDRVSILKRTEDGRTFVAREGEFLEDTDIKVATVSDTLVMLKQPEHRPTRFQFETDRMQQNIQNSIRLH